MLGGLPCGGWIKVGGGQVSIATGRSTLHKEVFRFKSWRCGYIVYIYIQMHSAQGAEPWLASCPPPRFLGHNATCLRGYSRGTPLPGLITKSGSLRSEEVTTWGVLIPKRWFCRRPKLESPLDCICQVTPTFPPPRAEKSRCSRMPAIQGWGRNSSQSL